MSSVFDMQAVWLNVGYEFTFDIYIFVIKCLRR